MTISAEKWRKTKLYYYFLPITKSFKTEKWCEAIIY